MPLIPLDDSRHFKVLNLHIFIHLLYRLLGTIWWAKYRRVDYVY